MTYDAIAQMGIPVHHRDLEAVIELIDGFIETGRRTGRSHQIVTVNTDFLVQAREHADVHAILRTADLALPDGMPVVWASAALGQRLPSRIAGADLVTRLAVEAEVNGYRLMFFGGGEGVADRAADLLRRKHPGLIVGTTTGVVSSTAETDPDVLDEIRAFRPDVICVALGHPKQERWIRRYASALGIPVAVGVGGTFDFIAGERKRAAPWIQRSGFEWLYRLAQEPGRLSQRYFTDFAVYLPSIFMQILRTRFRRGQRDVVLSRDRWRGWKSQDGVEVVRSGPETVVVALSSPGPVGYRTAATLTDFATRARRQGRALRLVVPGQEAVRSLEKLRLDRLLVMIPAGAGAMDDVVRGARTLDARPTPVSPRRERRVRRRQPTVARKSSRSTGRSA